MISDNVVASRYAKPLVEMAEERKVLDAVYEDMQLFRQVCEQNRNFINILHNPVVRGFKKLAILKALFQEHFNALTMALFELMAKKDREALLYQTSIEFAKLYEEHKNIQNIEVVSAIKLSEEQLNGIKQKIATQTGKSIKLKTSVDESLIGGLLVKIGDNQIDNSIKQNLQRIKHKLLSQSL